MSLLFSFALLWITLSLFLQHTGSASDFIQVPPNPQYVLKGGTARFVWTYSVGDKNTEFKSFSPIWFFNSQSVVIGRDNGFIEWKFQTSNITCPQRLLKPTVRVSRENQATLVIKDVIIADSGFYGCTLALLKGNDITNTTALLVTETPRFTVKPNTVTAVTEHKDLSISCKAVGPPSPRITLRSHVTNALMAQGIGSAVLHIIHVKRSQNGTKYECQATNNPNERPVNTSTTVVVFYPPEFTWAPHNTTVNQGHEIIIHCQATANPPVAISWQREHNAAIKSGYTQFGNGTLFVPNVVRSDAGKYICTANNVFDSKVHTTTSHAYVSVKYPPEIIWVPINTTVNQGQDVILHCQATANPPSSISWQRENNVAIKAGFTQFGNGTLIIPNANRSDAGKYICTAMNYFNSKSHKATTHAYVSVKYPPEFTNAPINTTVNQGHDIILHCQATANPPSSISWQRKNNVAIKSGFTQFGNGTLIIPNAVRSDAGSYICTAKNVFNHKLHTATIRAYVSVKFPPGLPNVAVTNIEALSATIRWTEPLYNGGSPITGYKLILDSKEYEFNDRALKEYTVSGLTKDTQLVARVYARNDVGYGNASSVYFRTKKQGPPAQPILESVVVNQTSVTLTWLKPEENGGSITGYIIYKKVVDGDVSWKQVAHIYGTPQTYTVKKLQPGKTYLFIITATNGWGESVRDSKCKIFSIPGTTKVPSTMIKQPECKGSSAQKNYQVAMIAVVACVCLLVISLIFNILSVVYFYRVNKRTKNTTEQTEEPTYDNLEMARSTAPTPSYVNVGITSLPSAEYEPVGHTNTIPSTYEIPGNQHAQTSRDHYQQLNTETMQHDPTVQYEPLRTQHVTTDQRDRLRNRPAVYQNLQKYSNA